MAIVSLILFTSGTNIRQFSHIPYKLKSYLHRYFIMFSGAVELGKWSSNNRDGPGITTRLFQPNGRLKFKVSTGKCASPYLVN